MVRYLVGGKGEWRVFKLLALIFNVQCGRGGEAEKGWAWSDRKCLADERKHLPDGDLLAGPRQGGEGSDIPENESFPTELCGQMGTCLPMATWVWPSTKSSIGKSTQKQQAISLRAGHDR